eukprot:CAMPEP_0170506102 /NCGR_PEP_ID=MMETSP0208-20121228/53610_1 /TAXON_ID=197538 /ORGANISM="Strombidium inclinatum, Strain S3" /LENGTH=47 /DNA_ID= /DNA_START= /DNA_END= /DNA_ORIENTATION=
MERVVDIDTSSDIELKLEITNDLVIKMEILKFDLGYEDMENSSIGPI